MTVAILSGPLAELPLNKHGILSASGEDWRRLHELAELGEPPPDVGHPLEQSLDALRGLATSILGYLVVPFKGEVS